MQRTNRVRNETISFFIFRNILKCKVAVYFCEGKTCELIVQFIISQFQRIDRNRSIIPGTFNNIQNFFPGIFILFFVYPVNSSFKSIVAKKNAYYPFIIINTFNINPVITVKSFVLLSSFAELTFSTLNFELGISVNEKEVTSFFLYIEDFGLRCNFYSQG